MAKSPKGKMAASNAERPAFIVKPIARSGGLDYLHITLLILIVILVALVLSLSRFTSVKLVDCQFGIVNGTCVNVISNSTAAIMAAKQIMAGYSTVNTSLSLLPYYTLPNMYKAYYIGGNGSWLVYTPYINPYTGNIVRMYLVLNSNMALNTSLMETLLPSSPTKNYVAAPGTVSISGKLPSSSNIPIPVNLIIDPYSVGSISAIKAAINASNEFGANIVVNYDFIFTSAAVDKYNGYGSAQTQQLAYYLFCASKQSNFSAFVNNTGYMFNGNPLTNAQLESIANESGINYTDAADCVANSAEALYFQSQFAQLYNVTSTPEFIVNGRYETISTRLGDAINYSLSEIRAS